MASRPRVGIKPAPPRSVPRLDRAPAPIVAPRRAAAAPAARFEADASGIPAFTAAHAPEPVIARAPSVHAPSPTPQSALSGPTLSRMPTVPSVDPSGPSYDQISAQLKRDLLRQRERMGDLLGDLPWA